MHGRRKAGRAMLLIATLLSPAALRAQDATDPPPLKPEEIDQLVAPIALYPDALLAQIMMASTYPLEVVEATRWAKSNPKVTGDALEQAMQQQSWDASVKSLAAFPQVLTMMNEQLDWTQQLGNAFLAQQKDVMDAVQRLRAKAKAEGNLETTKEQTVTVEQAPQTQTTVIQIEPANPQVVYVPTYNPTVVYGAWPYPAYPPYSYYPPGYVAATSLLSFGVGMAVGSALWGDCDWGHGNVNVNVNNYNNFNKTNINNKNWQHNVDHRKGVGYRDQASRDKYNRGGAKNAQSREAFRGRADQGRQELAREGGKGGNLGQGNKAGQGNKPGQGNKMGQGNKGQGNKPGQGNKVGQGHAGQVKKAGAGADRPAQRHEGVGSGRNPNAFKDVGKGNEVRQASNRGQQSRKSAHNFGGGGGGGKRGGGGGGGGGGGRRGGGGGRGRR
ncbi:MAG: DUF3300 domain-containing protein [Candidatus Binatia bacterium]